MKKEINFKFGKTTSTIMGFVVIILALVIVIGWFWGMPYLFHLVFRNISYTLFATVWLSIHLVRNIYGRLKAQYHLEQLANELMGGRK
ncbi:hypothetical protein [Bacillus amyloliquefaciens]|uniref:hypothetical protein n=1 Tax=Bacillus amyloliquefaciens TaxID=1390 RepID=UPI0005EE7AD0|nr:hypothetical protein [Bacillus amyloliquefaciens]